MMPHAVGCHGQFFCGGKNVDSLIEAIRAAYYKRGVPHALYVDNGSIYSSKEIVQICARVGCLLHHTPVRDGAAKGKVERFFRTVRDQFLARELDLSSLDALNRQFTQWVEEQYNAQVHSILGMSPLDRYALDRKWVPSSRPTRPTTSCSLSRRNATSAPTTRSPSNRSALKRPGTCRIERSTSGSNAPGQWSASSFITRASAWVKPASSTLSPMTEKPLNPPTAEL